MKRMLLLMPLLKWDERSKLEILEPVRPTRLIIVKMNLSIGTVDQLEVVENPMVACKMAAHRLDFRALTFLVSMEKIQDR